jgi:hypothetical protein
MIGSEARQLSNGKVVSKPHRLVEIDICQNVNDCVLSDACIAKILFLAAKPADLSMLHWHFCKVAVFSEFEAACGHE